MKVTAFKIHTDDDGKVRCCDCAGWPIEGIDFEPATFGLVVVVRDGKQELWGICEGCHLRRLRSRAMVLNIKLNLPELDVLPERPRPRPPNWRIPPQYPWPLKRGPKPPSPARGSVGKS